ncbi:hypothetical protein PPYR_11682 [Photinus pyralis]|uniref:Uncharacterized protein n=1 Tax=Photinus pyralis TaxID=7054 RepID=A0A1Y1KSB2_PHOPY|nr:hypothetical protein PPYR_11682 [Photinus pyralis]
MVKTKPFYILAASFTSAAAAILSIISLSTENWVTAKGQFVIINEPPSEIRYGLFTGLLIQSLGGSQRIPLYVTCLVSKNVCGYLCDSGQDRQDDLEKMWNNEKVPFTCYLQHARSITTRKDANSSLIPKTELKADDSEREFINAGLYISTVVFLGISAIFGLIAAALSVWNTAGNPIEVIVSIYGIYIYNAIACIASAVTLALWGALFGITILHNIGIFHTIQGDMKTYDTPMLGFSYWLNVPSCMLYGASIFILYLRDYFIRLEPEVKIHITAREKDVGDIMIF